MCIITKQDTSNIIIEKITQSEPCPICRGTGLENEEARLLWERKEGISDKELRLLISKKLYSKRFTTDNKTSAVFKITKMDLLQIIKRRGIWEPCHYCKGKGMVHNKNNKEEVKNENSNSNL